MNIRVHRNDFTTEDYVNVLKIRSDFDGDFLIDVKDNFAEFGASEMYVYGRDITSIEIRP
jgi:hypothetical protein